MKTVRLALPDLVSNSYFPAIAAVELGCFRDEGLEATLELHFPVTSAMQALRDGRFDLIAGAAHATLTAFPNWQGARLLVALAQHMYWFLVLRADLRAKRGDLDAVRGLHIGAAPGVDVGLIGLLHAAGIDPERNGVHIGPVPGTDSPSVSFGVTAAEALAAGRIDGFWANGMGAEVAVRSGAGTVVLDVRRGDGPAQARNFTFPALVTTQSLIERDPDTAAAAVRATVRAQAALRADPDLATGIGRKLFPPMEAALIAELIRRDLPYYDAAITPEIVDGLNGFARTAGLLNADVPYERAVATQYASLWEPKT
jgi:ABC-type nitrate/sulfonate/bicarbonate transport system substrate-binding protein